MRRALLAASLVASPLLAATTLRAQGVIPRRPATSAWQRASLGNHRIVLHVDQTAAAVVAQIPWRRRDATPENVAAILIDAKTQLRVWNVARMSVTRDEAWIVFQPTSGAGDYYLYYLPYEGSVTSNYPKISYRAVDDRPDRLWIGRNALAPGNAASLAWKQLPAARVVAYEAADEFSAFSDMEFTATKQELARLASRYAWAEYYLFAEDRGRSVRMADAIPARWAARGPFEPFSGTAARGEFFTFQLGVFAHRKALDSISLEFTDLVPRAVGGTGRIPASALTVFNLEGVDWSGQRFTRAVHVEQGKVQALWVGIDIPTSVAPGEYQSDVTFSARGVQPRKVRVELRVLDSVVANHGDDVPSRLTRLRWLNSQLAADDDIVPPYTPMTVSGTTIGVLGRALTFGEEGLPRSIASFFTPTVTSIGTTPREVLASDGIALTVMNQDGSRVQFTGAPARVTKKAPGAVEWAASRSTSALNYSLHARMEFDGTTEFRITLSARDSVSLRDVRLTIPMRGDAARYMMGLGQKGGIRPATLHWTWDVEKKNQDAAWIGDVNAGLQFTLKDEHYVRPLNTNFYLSKPLLLPRSWGNAGLGGCNIEEQVGRNGGASEGRVASVRTTCYSGPRVMRAGDSLRFDFRLMITPFKPLDTTGQWGTRYFHAFVPIDSIAKRGANTVNVHHATRVNPWINYPFLEPAQMKAYIDSAHARKMKVKIYYTVRELTNHAPELFALRSLGDEVLSHGPGGGYSWLQEHVGADYIPAWHVPEIRDAAIVNSGVSRWHNFFVEGLDWLVKNVGIDGLYIDDVAFDRITMERVRKVLDRGNPGALIDLHSANQYNPRDGFASSANLYLEHFPFLNRLWFGEYFDYDSRPDYWLVELSGIPFGLMSEMLEKGGNPWRGMTFGMTNRMPWSGDPSPLWSAWDDFGIAQSRMIGWWSPNVPVKTGNADVRATAYVRSGRTMISLASWSSDTAKVKLELDWSALGLNAAMTHLRVPAIEDFQEAATYAPGDVLAIPPGRGLLLIAEPR